jgi:hypothetical protein
MGFIFKHRDGCALLITVKGVLVVPRNHMEVFGIYRSDVQAGLAVVRLMESGFSSHDISVLLQDHRSARAAAHETNTEAPEGTKKVTTADRTFGFLGEVNPVALPGVGPFIAVGPIMETLREFGVDGASGAGGAGGDLSGALVDMGIAKSEATRYEERIKEGAVLLSVRCDSSVTVTRAKNLLKQMGGQDIASSGEASAAHGAAPQDGPGARV